MRFGSLVTIGRRATPLWALAVALCVAGAQNTPPTTESPQRTASVPRVYLITVGLGQEVWEKFGHNALWFVDDATGLDEAYNWGVFDFNQPHFLQRFLTGDTKYWVEQYPGRLLIDYYRRSDRTVVVQRLNFTPAQTERALAYSRWNARNENKFYRYDYFRDNCSTRVRDVIDRALGGALKTATSTTRTRYTYKSESVRLTDDLKFTQLGIYTALGEPADRELSLWELMFIPMRMRDVIRAQRVVGANGTSQPLVTQERVLYESRAHHERATAPRLWLAYLVIGLLLGAEFAAVGGVRNRPRLSDRVFRVEVVVWSVLTGLLGLVLLLAWTTTRHVFWYRNENLLVLSPLALWLALVVILSFRRPRYARAAVTTASVIALLAVLALAAKLIPGFTQQNVALIVLVLPAQLAIAAGLRRRVSADATALAP